MPDAGHIASAHSYEVLGKLAEGGMTEIFLARAKGAGAVERFVVLKRLKRAVTTHVELVRLFLDEARLASQLQHPNVAQVFEVGKLGGSYFFAMEFVNGETLQSLMLHARTRKIQIPVRAVLTIAAAVAAGLHHAHDRKGTDGQSLQIVHGEVSPTNVLVSQEGIVKLVDFGVAKAGEHGGSRISPYASPEQCIGSRLDRRSDLFSLGIVLWELLTLDGLYHRASDNDISYAIATEEPPKPSTKRYDVPPELDAVILRLLAKDPAERFQDADELLAAIESLAQKLSILLSTADLSRMMRLWFGTKSEPTTEAAEPAPEPLLVSSEEIPDDLAIPVESPIDHQLETVRNAASLIITRATERARNTTGRPDKAPTVPPELMDNPNENFEQVRDRILARARQKKETMRNQIGVVSITQVPASEARPGSGDRHTRITATPLGGAAEEPRKKPASTPPEARNGSNGHHADAAPRTSADGAVMSGELGGRTYDAKSYALGAAARIDAQMPSSPAAEADDDDRGSTVADVPPQEVPPREAPPAVANVAAPASTASAITSSTSSVAAGEMRGDTAAASDTEAAAATSDTEAAAAVAAPAPDVSAPDAKSAVDDAANAAREADAKAARTADAKAASDADAKAARTADAKLASDADAKAARTADAKAASDADAKAARDAERAARKAEREERAAAAERAARANSDASLGAEQDRERAEAIATARASTAEIMRRVPRRPVWILPAIGAAALLLVVLVIAKLSGGDDKPRAKASPQVASNTGGTNAAARPAGTAAHANHAGTTPGTHDTTTGAQPSTDPTNAGATTAGTNTAGTTATNTAGANTTATNTTTNTTTNGAGTATNTAGANTGATNTATNTAATTTGTTSGAANTTTTGTSGAAGTNTAATGTGVSKTIERTNTAATTDATKTGTSKTDTSTSGSKTDTSKTATSDTSTKTVTTGKKDTTETRQTTKKDSAETTKKDAAETTKKTDAKKSIEELFAAGEFAKTNTACTKEIVFTAQKLEMCAQAACQTSNAALAKRWINAISKSSRPPLVEKCKSLGVELEAPAAPQSPPASP